MHMANAPDLQQVGEIYNACLEIIRKQPLEGFDKEAMVWLRGARYEVMKEVERNFFTLEQSIRYPLLRPKWAMDPSEHLCIYTETHAFILKPYTCAIKANLRQLMDDCGFHATVSCIESSSGLFYAIHLYFQRMKPIHQTVPALVVNDEFSCPSNFSERMQRLLTNRSGDNEQGDGSLVEL